ncbi:MAG: YceI family protein [Flavobacterium sp.]|nr:MAG: YceI family protein [Flavobacterium sp.]
MNNVPFMILLIIILSSCTKRHKTDLQQATVTELSVSKEYYKSDTLAVDLTRSIIQWKGTKMRGLGKHEGRIELANGFFTISDGRINGGHFIADMNSITVTDIPDHEPVPRRRFNNHMKSEDFFDSASYPVSKFEITTVQYKSADSLIVAGNLTIKEITRNISFTAKFKDKALEARFTIDRFQWNIGYKGSWVDKTLVDKDILLNFQLFTE